MGTVVNEDKTSPRSARFGFRATPQQQMLIHQAAEALNKSVTEFVLESACVAAENTLLNQRLFLLEDKDYQAFLEALDRPAQKKSELQKLLKEKAPWE